jgi:hypothetical protein
MAYFNLEMETTTGTIHWPDVKEIVEILRAAADHIEQRNGPFLQGIDGNGKIIIACDMAETCTGTLKYRRELQEREAAMGELFKQATAK